MGKAPAGAVSARFELGVTPYYITPVFSFIPSLSHSFPAFLERLTGRFVRTPVQDPR